MFLGNEMWVLDGGLATELERRGHDLSGSAWSARLIQDDPAAIRGVHQAYLAAGADIITAATYQVGEKYQDFYIGTDLAVAARNAFWRVEENRVGRRKPLVAASIGAYGAVMANGAEYTGDYDFEDMPPNVDAREVDNTPVGKLIAHHKRFVRICQETRADLIACETIPSFMEAEALVTLFRRFSQKPAWISFSCRDGERISDGTPIRACAALLDGEPMVAAIGVNCTRPIYVENLIKEIRAVSDKPIVVYPNSGEVWDGVGKCWIEGSNETVESYVERAVRWREAGATIIGGCCRTEPEHVGMLRKRLG